MRRSFRSCITFNYIMIEFLHTARDRTTYFETKELFMHFSTGRCGLDVMSRVCYVFAHRCEVFGTFSFVAPWCVCVCRCTRWQSKKSIIEYVVVHQVSVCALHFNTNIFDCATRKYAIGSYGDRIMPLQEAVVFTDRHTLLAVLGNSPVR